MIINKITVGWITQRFDMDKKRFISQEFFAGDQVDFEKLDGTIVKTEELLIDEKEIYHSFDMVQPETIHIRLHDLEDNSLGIVKTNISAVEFEALLFSFSSSGNGTWNIDLLISYIKKKYPDYLCERFLITREMKLNI